MNFRSLGSTVFVNRRPTLFACSPDRYYTGILCDATSGFSVAGRILIIDTCGCAPVCTAAARGAAAQAKKRKFKTTGKSVRGEEKEAERQFPGATRGPGLNRSLLSYRTPILIRTRSMQVGWMPASSPGGTTRRYNACNLFLLPPIFFLPLDQLLLIPRRRRRASRAREASRRPARGYVRA